MPMSLKVMLKKFAHKGQITQEEYDALIKKLDGHDKEIRNNAIDEFAEKLGTEFSEQCGEIKVEGITYDILTLDSAIEIMWDLVSELKEEVAKEYGKDTNVRSNDFISRSVLLDKLQKWKFANEERGYDTASDLVQEMINLVKEQPLPAPYQKGE